MPHELPWMICLILAATWWSILLRTSENTSSPAVDDKTEKEWMIRPRRMLCSETRMGLPAKFQKYVIDQCASLPAM
jgi:hypothetical protein